MQVDDIQFTTLKSCWMKLQTMAQILAAVNIETEIDGLTARNLGFCINDISYEINETLNDISGDEKNERCS